MASLRRGGRLCALLAAGLVFTARSAAAVEQADFFLAIRQELARLNLAARCDDESSTCTFPRTLGSPERQFQVVVRHNRRTSTVYIYIDRFITLTGDAGPTKSLASRLLSLNNEMVTAKFEWDDAANVIRLSATLNTDSNFDRKAFRSQIKGLLRVAEELWPELNDAGQKN